jgi:hypothetical protein
MKKTLNVQTLLIIAVIAIVAFCVGTLTKSNNLEKSQLERHELDAIPLIERGALEPDEANLSNNWAEAMARVHAMPTDQQSEELIGTDTLSRFITAEESNSLDKMDIYKKYLEALKEENKDLKRTLESQSETLSTKILIFGGLIVLCYMLILWRKNAGFGVTTIRLILVTLVIVGSLFSLSAGFSSEQIAPVIGLFGTLLGFLLGKNDPKDSSSPESVKPVNE